MGSASFAKRNPRPKSLPAFRETGTVLGPQTVEAKLSAERRPDSVT